MPNSTILMKLGIKEYTKRLKSWVGEQIANSSSKIGGLRYETDEDGVWLYIIDDTEKGNQIGNRIDVSDFIMDGMLQDVIPEKDENDKNTGVFIFEFNIKDPENPDKNKTIKVDFSKYVDTYSADKETISLDDNNTFSVIKVPANITKTSTDILVKGGPLESQFKNAGYNTITAGTSIEDLLRALVQQELWPTKSNIKPYEGWLKLSIDNPKISYTASEVEVGSTVTYSASNGKTSYTYGSPYVSGFTYGYSSLNNDEQESTSSSYYGSNEVTADAGVKAKLILTGCVEKTVYGDEKNPSADAAKTSGSITIKEGDNEIDAACTSITYSGKCSKIPKLYGCSNMGRTQDGVDSNGNAITYDSTQIDEKTLTTTVLTSNTITANCIGKYKVFVGYTDKIPTTSDDVRDLTVHTRLGTGACGTSGIIYTVDKDYMIVAIPTGWDFTIKNDLDSNQRNSFYKSSISVPVKLPNHTDDAPSTKSYDIWYCVWPGGEYKNLTIQ